MMISYAQNAEDVVLERLFRTQANGFYVDIGAGHPTLDSVTKHFYDRGWSGVNVEPMRRMYMLLCDERSRDTNVFAAVSDTTGAATLYEAPEGNLGASTLYEHISDASFEPTTVPTVTLPSLLAEHGVGAIDFLKIDVEGHEAPIITSADWATIRPRVIIVEAVRPGTNEPAHQVWEPTLLGTGYVCVLFDGINRFYASAGDEDAKVVLSAPANVLDDYAPWRWVSEIEGAKAHIANLDAALREAETYAKSLSERLQELDPGR